MAPANVVATAPPITTIRCGHADKILAWDEGLCSTSKLGCTYDASVTIDVMDRDHLHKRWAAQCDSERREYIYRTVTRLPNEL